MKDMKKENEIYKMILESVAKERDSLKKQVAQMLKNEQQYYDHLVNDLGYDNYDLHVKVYSR